MGTIKASFWKGRFLVSADEFSEWADFCESEGFYLTIGTLGNPRFSFEDLKSQYNKFYALRMDSEHYHKRIAPPTVMIRKDGFNSGIHASGAQSARFWYKDGTTSLDYAFVQFSSCKHHSVTSECGKYFTYEDILQKEPLAKEYFDKLTTPLKSITKPLYMSDKPMYSVRISRQAYIDLRYSAFNNGMREPLTAKWKL